MASLPAGRITLDELDGVFDGEIRRSWTSPFYLLWVLFVAIAMVLLPAIYIGLIGLVAYGLYYHATQDVGILGGGTGGGMKGRLFVYVAPLVCGAVMLLFMVKPLFARPARRTKEVSLIRTAEPVLFGFVDRICKLVGSRSPSRIELDCDVNASAGLLNGWRGFFTGELALTIGAPLVTGLTVQEFAGVLAHEFGHFTQGVAMRLSYVVRSINGWFARVVYERDEWDEKLESEAEGNDGWLGMMLQLARLAVWLSRRILWVLMIVGHAISCGLMRQMEYDADRSSFRLAGADAFESTDRKLCVLAVSLQAAHSSLSQTWRDRKLADNLPMLVMSMKQSLPEELRNAIEKSRIESKTGLLDTHPASPIRVALARREASPGVVHGTGPASGLFRDFDLLAREITFSYYREVLGEAVQRQNLIPVPVAERHREEAREVGSAVESIFTAGLLVTRPLAINRDSKIFGSPPREVVARLKRSREAMIKFGPAIEKTFKRFTEATENLARARVATAALRAKLKIDAADYKLKKATPEEARIAYDSAQSRVNEVIANLIKIEQVQATRLMCGLALLKVPAVTRKIEDAAALADRASVLLANIAHRRSFEAELRDVRDELPVLRLFASVAMQGGSSADIKRETHGVIDAIQKRLRAVQAAIRNAAYPFDHAEDRIALANYVFGEMPDLGGNAQSLLITAEQAVENLDEVYARVIGELTAICHKVETTLRLDANQEQASETSPSA